MFRKILFNNKPNIDPKKISNSVRPQFEAPFKIGFIGENEKKLL